MWPKYATVTIIHWLIVRASRMATGRDSPRTTKEKSSKPAIRMYHVTNSTATAKPDWSDVHLCVPYDEHYDGDLCGLPVACFSTTLYNGKLPTISTYPRDAEPGTEHWRVSVPLDLDDYDIFLMHKVDKQVQLLCLTKDAKSSSREKNLKKTLIRVKSVLGEEGLKEYFPDGKPNDYACKEQNFFVNIHFVEPVPLMLTTAKEWSTVEKRGEVYKPIEKLYEKWIENYKKKYSKNVEELTEEFAEKAKVQ